MRHPREQLSSLKLRTTLQQLKQFSLRNPHLPQSHPILSSTPVGITLLSLQPYRSKRRGEQRSNRENIQNQLKIEIFKKIKATMQSRLNYNGLEIAKATMHCNRPTPQTNTQKAQRQARRRRIHQERGLHGKSHHHNRSLRVKTQNTSSYRPYESTNHYYPHPPLLTRKPITSERKLRTEQRLSEYNEENLNGWNIHNQEEEFCPRP